MSTTIAKELAVLERMTVGELHNRYAEVFGEQARSRHKQYLVRRIAWRIQANAEGGLSERALRRAEELADVRDVRVTPPRAATTPRTGRPAPATRTAADRRLPAVGAAITRKYHGQTITVTVLADGFDYAGERYRSLTAAEIEAAVIDQIRCIGQDPGMLAETLGEARRQAEAAIERLAGERRTLERGLKRCHAEISQPRMKRPKPTERRVAALSGAPTERASSTSA